MPFYAVVSANRLFSKGDMALNSIESMNIPNQENFVQEAEVDGIDILVYMAKQGKIDPWNIDIVDITDKYLMHLFKSKAQNLRLTGRTLWLAAMLLKLKSNVLEGLDINDFEPQHDEDMYFPEDDELDYTQDDYIPTSNVISIDEVLQRRTSVRLNHNRVVTLRDLIRQLEFYEQLDKKQALRNSLERAARRRGNSLSRMTTEDIFKMQHDEYIAEGVARLKDNLEEILNRQDKIELNELTLLGMDRISAYISLLFLTVDSDYDLEQDEFYSDLYVVKCPHVDSVAEELDESLDNAKSVLSEQEVNDGAVEVQN